MLVLKAGRPCVVCQVFDEGVGHCREWLDYEPPAELVRRLFRCDSFERKFYRFHGRTHCSHGRDLSCLNVVKK